MTNITNILVRNGFVSTDVVGVMSDVVSDEHIATVLMNLEYYGFSLSKDAYQAVRRMPTDAFKMWWSDLETELKIITGDDRNIGDFVVYKNFPEEVLDKSASEYWLAQILMYWGVPNEFFTEEVKPREDMNPAERNSITLKLANNNTIQDIFDSLLSVPAKWKRLEKEDVLFLSLAKNTVNVDFSKISFKENLVSLVAEFIKNDKGATVSTATDVLRLGAGLSDADVSLREKVKFKSFNRPTRRFLLKSLEGCTHLEEDVARRKNVWKRFLHQLHPGDYKSDYPKVFKVADDLYNDRLSTFNSKVEELIRNKNIKALDLLKIKPGEFSRRLAHMTDVYGQDAVDSFADVLPKLSTAQIVALRKHFDTLASRKTRIFTPKGSLTKLQIAEAKSVDSKYADAISASIGKVLAERVPKVKVLDINTDNIKLPNSGSDEGEYTRGTVFQIPNEVTFIRTASYWKNKSLGNSWFDNGWNFFDADWKTLGACCWDRNDFGNSAAIFSGDPTNSKEMQGRAAQLIDIYPDKLLKQGVRYAVWNVLCFSRIKFSEAEDVFAALQWGESPTAGNLFEPSRCQLSFQLKGDYLTKYVCVLDLDTREMTYLDANFKAEVNSAISNGKSLSTLIPAFMEHINAIPSVYDLFKESVDEDNGEGYIIYTDKDVVFEDTVKAYCFKQEGNNKFENIDINEILSDG